MLVGMCASGKSTYAVNAARSGYIIVNDDAVVNAVHGDDYKLYDSKLKFLYKGVESFIANTALAMGRPIVVDRALSCSAAARQRWIAMARSLDVPCEVVSFPFEGIETHARRRLESGGRGHPLEYWLKVVSRHASIYVEPSLEEGLDTIHLVSFKEIQEGKVF